VAEKKPIEIIDRFRTEKDIEIAPFVRFLRYRGATSDARTKEINCAINTERVVKMLTRWTVVGSECVIKLVYRACWRDSEHQSSPGTTKVSVSSVEVENFADARACARCYMTGFSDIKFIGGMRRHNAARNTHVT